VSGEDAGVAPTGLALSADEADAFPLRPRWPPQPRTGERRDAEIVVLFHAMLRPNGAAGVARACRVTLGAIQDKG
jgi:hypothetical protein